MQLIYRLQAGSSTGQLAKFTVVCVAFLMLSAPRGQQLVSMALCAPSTQPQELADNQIGFSTQTDQRKYLDIADSKLHSVNLSEVWRLPHQDERTSYNLSLLGLQNRRHQLVELPPSSQANGTEM